MSGNSGAWGIALWKDGRGTELLSPPQDGISLSGGDAVEPYLPTVPLGFLTVPPDGMGVPPVRSGDVAFAQRDGVVQFGDYYEPRQVTLRVDVQNDDCPGCNNAPEVQAALVLDGVFPGRATTPDAPALDITGDLDVSVYIAMDDWTPSGAAAPISKWVTAGMDQRSWTTRINTAGTLGLFWSNDGATTLSATSTAVPVVADGAGIWLRFILDVDNGAAGRSILFYTSPDGVSWTQLGATVVQAGVTSIFNSTAPVTVGGYNNGGSERFAGRVFEARVRTGIDGTIVANPIFDQPPYTTSFVDDQGNPWDVIAPAYLQPFVAEKLSARKKVKRLTEEWSRNCDGATLVIFSDCHDPDATEEEKTYQGPYLLHGRPRVAEVTWRPSNIGGAEVLLRFDAEDARLLLADTDEGAPWFSEHTADALVGNTAGGNLAQNYRLDGLTMTLNGATVQDTHLSAGAPDGGSYFQRIIISPNTTSPMQIELVPGGLSAIPVDPGDILSVAFWARKNPGGGPSPRVDWTWFNAAGGTVSNHSGMAQSATADWQRFEQSAIVAPALAEFFQPRLVWTGTALAGQTLDLAQAWINEGATATAPTELEVVGDMCAFPVIYLFGPLTAPINVFYGPYQFTYNTDISGAESVTVDTRWGRASTITVDTTQEISGNYTSPLDPGMHEFSITTGNPADTGGARIEWSNSVVSG